MQASNSSRKKKKPNNTWLQFGLALLICVLILGSYVYLSRRSVNSPEIHDLSNYEALITRAQELSRKYKNLTHNVPGVHSLQGGSLAVERLSLVINKSPLPSQPMSAKKDIVIGIAQDTDTKNIAVFCSSLREVAKEVEVVIFVNKPVSELSKSIFVANSVVFIEYDLASMKTSKFHPSTLRWELIFHYFEDPATRNKYRRVLMIDVRDSFFQLNPFATIFSNNNEEHFYVFQGVESIPIGDCGWNGGWVRDCFGDNVLNQISRNAIICSGVSIATVESAFQYLTLMNDLISGSNSQATALGFYSKFPQCERNGVDQGVHNVLVHKGLIPNMEVFSQRESLVANMQAKQATVGSDNIVHNPSGATVAVVHQYDRFPALQSHLFKKYVHWVDTSSPEAMWKGEEACASYTYENNVDLFKGVCDLKMIGGAASASSCCSRCNQQLNCKAFTFYSGVCYLKSCNSKAKGPKFLMPDAVSAYTQ